MMEMGECEICNRYRHAKHKGEQLEILAELNDVPRHKIIGILLENGENVKLPIRTRGQRFVDRFNKKAECIMDDYATWEDQIQILKEECGLDFKIRRNDTDVKVR